jgi:hypothetical protein
MTMNRGLVIFVLPAMAVLAAELSGDEIMARVAANQDKSLAERRNWTYRQTVLTRLNRTNGKLAREEDKEYAVAPTPEGFEKELVRFSGKYEHKGKLVGYDKPGYEYKEIDIDGELADDLADDLMSDESGKDGLSPGLFPLTVKEQKKYDFKLRGRQRYRDHEVYRIEFTPKKAGIDDDNSFWAGEALIDTAEFQPVLITSFQAKPLPIAVKMLLGTNLKHLGFKVQYKKIDDGLWFPVSCGGEFSLRALFFYGRNISIAMNNSGFQKTDVQSRVVGYEPIAAQTGSGPDR